MSSEDSKEKIVPIRRKLVGIIEIRFKLNNRTGLLIRSPLAKASIGGIDVEPMIARKKYVLARQSPSSTDIIDIDVPYIPGSSLKGRMRSLLELHEGAKLYFDGKIFMHYRNLSPNKKDACKDLDHALDNLFGMPSIQLKDLIKDIKYANEVASKIAPTRLIVEDIFPSETYVMDLYSSKGFISKEDFFEEKSENRIDRITSAADPRFIVRVKPDVEFEGKMKILLFDVDLEKHDGKTKAEEYLDLVFAGLKLIEDTYLGGSGSRGYGKVEFKDIELVLKTPNYYLGRDEPIILGKLSSLKDYGSVKEEIIDKIIGKLGEQLQ